MEIYTKPTLMLIVGPMFCGKSYSIMLMDKLKQYFTDKKTLILKPIKDDRYAGTKTINMHTGEELPCIACENLCDLDEQLLDINLIMIDEIQFFKPADVVKFIEKNYIERKISMLIVGLNGTNEQKPFESVSCVVPYATKILNHIAVCMVRDCDGEGPYTIKTGGHKPNSEIEIGGAEMYKSVCLDCLNKFKSHIHLDFKPVVAPNK